MNWRVVGTIIIIVVLASFAVKAFWQNQPHNAPPIESIPMEKITLTSTAFEHNKAMPAKYTCDGENINPPLEIKGVPSETKSLALIMDDPDAPAGTWDHWVKFNMPPNTPAIEEGKEPTGVSGKGTRGNLSYKGPCPPSGVHHYIFTVYALDILLNLPSGASKKEVQSAMAAHILGKGVLVGLYSRQ